MAIPLIAAAVAAGASVIGGLVGASSSAADREQALKFHDDAIKAWMDVHIPDPQQQRIFLQRFIQTGQMDPKLEETVQQESSEFKKIQVDPAYRAAQLRGLSSLENIGTQGGMTLSDKANLEEQMIGLGARERGQREALMSNFAARGMGGTGLELQAQLQGQQAAQNLASQQSMHTAASARDRALQAIMGSGQLAGQIGQEEYGRGRDVAAQQDVINRFNVQNMQGVQERNIGRQNEAQRYNLGLQQDIANANVDLANKEQIYNRNLAQQQFENQSRKAAGLSGQYGGAAQAYGQNAKDTADMWANIGSNIGQGVAAAYKYGSRKKNEQEEGY